MPDALIETKQGSKNAPAYRGLAYVVFEDFPLETYGNRIPQISIEVIKPAGALEKNVKAVNLIPAVSEFAYDTKPTIEKRTKLQSVALNVHQSEAETDFIASLDNLQATCPNLEQVSIVVGWFGDDIRAGQCSVQTKVEVKARQLASGAAWQVAGLSRSDAQQVTQSNGVLAYGGTPSDNSIINAILEIKSRGLRVGITPFLLMDIEGDNQLPNPYGGNSQPEYPWRGRMTTSSGPDTKINANRTEIDTFLNGISVTGGAQWGYRKFILHYAKLAQQVGGVDQFLIGSEMRGLTAVRDSTNAFPFVEGLIALAADIRGFVGAKCLVSYGADWSEYFHYKPDNASGDVFYNLDALWASPHIDAVGIDNYFPLSDYRGGQTDVSDGRAPNDPLMLQMAVEGEEGYDWYYQDLANRELGVRSPITDGEGKPWVFRYKDIRNWAANLHFDRRNGQEVATPSAWLSNMKPIIFTELGCPAVHNGATRPNVFPDPKSSENAEPWFSNGRRDDGAQAAYLNSVLSHWDIDHPDYDDVQSNTATNPTDMSRCQLWVWDARPFPAFPTRKDVWSDAENWQHGHWLNGRLGRLRLGDLIKELLQETGIISADTTQVYGVVDGFVFAENTSMRGALETLLEVFNITVNEAYGQLVFRSAGNEAKIYLQRDQLLIQENNPVVSQTKEQGIELPNEVSLDHLDRDKNYAQTKTVVRSGLDGLSNQQQISLPITSSANEVSSTLEDWLQRRLASCDAISFSLPLSQISLTTGDVVELGDIQPEMLWKITEIEEGGAQYCSAVGYRPSDNLPSHDEDYAEAVDLTTSASNRPLVRFLGLPYLPFGDEGEANRIAVAAVPWNGPQNVYQHGGDGTYEFSQSVLAPATIGELLTLLPSTHVTSRWQHTAQFNMKLYNGELSSSTNLGTLNGKNALAIGSQDTGWEIVQFISAEPLGNDEWRLGGLLRGQAGTEDLAAIGWDSGYELILLDAAIDPLVNSDTQVGRELSWAVGNSGANFSSANYSQSSFAPSSRHLTPFAPAHLKAELLSSGAIRFHWIRRERTGRDDWQFLEVPMSEVSETYQIQVSRNAYSLTKLTNLTQIDFSADELGTGNGALTIKVSQMSALLGAGIPSTMTITN